MERGETSRGKPDSALIFVIMQEVMNSMGEK